MQNNFDYVFNDVGLIGTASNITKDENPSFTINDFFEIYPQFRDNNALPPEMIEMYIDFADSAVNIKKWGKQWKLGMSLFVAHFCTVYMMSFSPEGSSAAAVIAAGQTKGLVSSKSVGDVSVSYDFSYAIQDVATWGQFNLTSFGNQFVSIAKMMSKGNMFIW